jgi:cytochrome b pre-mRNA-processing protein 3
MLRWLRKRAETGRTAEDLYGSVVAMARQPAFYRVLGVPDTPGGRFELVVLHLYLALQALRGPNANDVKQCAIEAFVIDMDDCMREMGVGDLSVPKKVRRAAGAFYERATIYQRDLVTDKSLLATSLGQYIFGDGEAPEGATSVLAHYVREASAALAETDFVDWAHSEAGQALLGNCLSNSRMTVT